MQESKRPTTHHDEPAPFSNMLMGWAQQGFDSFLATQRILMDFATRKSESAIKTVREGFSDPDHSPIAILTEMAVEATSNLTEAQRVLLDMAKQENDIIMGGVKDQISGYPIAAGMADRVRRGIDTFVEAQQEYLTTATKHVQKRLEATRAGKGPDVQCLVDAARDAMDNFVHAQKKFLTAVTSDDTKGKKVDESHKKKEVTVLAREAANSFIEAQKKLLDLAGQQVNVNVQSAKRAMEMMEALRPRLLPNISGEGIKNFVDAEKDLISSMMQAPKVKVVKVKTAPSARGKRVVRRRKVTVKTQAAAV